MSELARYRALWLEELGWARDLARCYYGPRLAAR